MKVISKQRILLALVFTILVVPVFLVVRDRSKATLDQALITAIDRAEYKRAIGLLHAGADANACKGVEEGLSLGEILRRLFHRVFSSSASGTPALVLLLQSTQPVVNVPKDPDDPDFLQLVMVLLEHHANVNATDAEGSTPLLLALRADGNRCAASLLGHHADVNRKDSDGVSPLMACVEGSDPQMVQKLLQCGARVNDVNSSGKTALMYAVHAGHPEIVQILCNAGANTQVKANGGESALSIARERSYRAEVIPILMRAPKP